MLTVESQRKNVSIIRGSSTIRSARRLYCLHLVPQIRPWVLTDFGCRVLNLHILRTSVQGDLTPPRSNNNTNTTAQTLSSERKHSRGSDDPLTALKKGAVLLRNGDNYYSRPKTQDFQEFCPGPPGSSQNPPFGSSSPHVLGKVVGSSIPQPLATT